MIYKKRAVIIPICILIIIALFLFSAYSTAAEKPKPPAYTKLLSIGAERFLLKNGLNVILKKDSQTPTAAITLLVNTGSATEGPYSGSGITHFIEHMMFKGTANYTAEQLENELKSLGAEIGAYTSFDYTCFKVQAPAASLKKILHILTDMVANPAFLEEEFQRERQVILREIDMGDDDPEKHLNKLLWQTAYIQHPYRNPVIGYSNVFQGLQLQDLITYYSKFYIPNNMILSIVGDIESSQVLEDIKQTLGTLTRKKFASPVTAVEPEQISSRQFFKNFAISRPMMLVGFHTVEINNPDLYALDTLAIILGGGLTSRLYKSLHDDKGLVYSIGSYNYTPRHPGLFVISAMIKEKSVTQEGSAPKEESVAEEKPASKEKPVTKEESASRKESVVEAVKAIREEIERIKKSPPKESELKRARAQVLSSYLFGLETQQDKADALAVSFTMTGDLDFPGKYIKGIENVTAEDITHAVSKYLTEENMTTVTLLPEEKEAKEAPQAEARVEAKTTKKLLPNGLTVLITENPALPICSVTTTIKGGLRAENEKNNGISNLTVLTMLKGSSRYKKEQIADFVESHGAQFSPYCGNNSFGFILDFMSKDIEKMLDLLANILLHPTFPEKELDIVKSDVLAEIELLQDDIFKSTNILLRRNLFKNHPYSFISIGSKGPVSNISREDLTEFHEKYCVAKNCVISISGGINTKNVFEIVKDKFKNMPEGEAFEIEQKGLKAIKNPKKVTGHMDKKQAVIMIGFRGASLYNTDRYPLQVLSSLFSGGAGRLYSQIRQKEGLAYTLGTFGMTGLDTGAFIFYAATIPQNVDHVRDRMFSQIQQICAGKIADDEINAAKKTLITKHELNLQNNKELALQTGLDELYGLGYDYYTHYSDIINSVTKRNLIDVAKKYFKLNKSVTAITKCK